MARRTRRLGSGSPAAGEVAAQHSNGADAPIVLCDQIATARGSFGALGGVLWAIALTARLKSGESD
jgi:hypothetical protein